MKRRYFSAVGVSLLLAAMLVPASAVAKAPLGTRPTDSNGIGHPAFNLSKADLSKLPSLARSTQRQMLFVQLSGRPVTSYQAAQLATAGTRMSEADKAAIRGRLVQQQANIKNRIAAIGGRVQSSFTDTANGFRVFATVSQAREISRLSGVTSITAVPLARRQDLQSADYIQAIKTWDSAGLTGKGVKIAVIDTGINYYHKNFAGAGNPGWKNDDTTKIEPGSFPTAKVLGGYDFVGDDYNPEGTPAQQTPHPDPDPLDCKSATAGDVQHGDHVAGIAAGMGVKANGAPYSGPYTASAVNGTDFRIGPGIAPEASLYAYRVFGCDGSTFVVADAIERAVRDNVDVINMSLGADFGNPNTIDSIASNAAAQAGVVVVASAGNAGPSAYIAGSPAVAQRVISVGAVDASLFLSEGAIVDFTGSATDVGGWNMYQTPLPVSGTMRVLVDDTNTLRNGCAATDYTGVVAGDIVAIRRGDCDFSTKRGFAQDAGAAGVVLVNNEDATVINAVEDPAHSIPMVSVNPSHEAELRAGDGLSTTLHDGDVQNENYGHAASFSSAGPARFSNGVKPDVMAPGVDVVSTDGATVAQGKSLGGTSMASPQVAGAAALVLQAHPGYTTAHVKGVLVGSANSALVTPYTVRGSGAGVVNAFRATRTVTWAESMDAPGSSSFTFGYDAISINRNGGDAYNETHSFRLQNTSYGAITYNLRNDQETDTYGFVLSMPSSVTVPARSSRTINVTLSLSNAGAAALPDMAPGDVGPIGQDGKQLFAPLVNVAGAILADPTSSGTGLTTVRVPWIVVPRATSQMRSEQRTPFTGATVKNASVHVKNQGVHDGNIDVFAWGLSDQSEGQGSIDLRAAGVQSLPTEFCSGSPDSSDRCMIFAINTWHPWQSGADNEFDVNIDTDNDGTADFQVVGIDGQVILGNGFEGVPISVVIDLHSGSLVDVWFATAVPNSSTYLLPVLASELGRDVTHPRVMYWVESYPGYDGGGDPGNPVFQFDVMYTGSEPGEANTLARFDAFGNAISQGDFFSLDPGEAVDVPLTIHTGRYHPTSRGQKGWMFVNIEGPDGAGQADLIPVGSLNN